MLNYKFLLKNDATLVKTTYKHLKFGLYTVLPNSWIYVNSQIHTFSRNLFFTGMDGKQS
jgi:hypothetical protein